MNWRKSNRWIHRNLGYLFFGMAIVYGISGIALNHGVARHWDPGIISTSREYNFGSSLEKEGVGKEEISGILEITGESRSYKQYYFPTDNYLMIYLRGGHITVELDSGKIMLTKVRNRPFFREVNYLHYNKPKKLWTWFSDLFGLALVLLAISGALMTRGKRGVNGWGAIAFYTGIIIPLLFLLIHLWL